MSAEVLPGFTRDYFCAQYVPNNGAADAAPRPIVLCIDRLCNDKPFSDKPYTDKPCADKPSTAARSESPVANTLRSAITLAEQEPLLQCVANWLDQDFQWRPIAEQTPVSVDLTLRSTHSAAHMIGLSLGETMQTLPRFPDELNELVSVQEHKRLLKVCLANLNLSSEDQQRLQPGSCIVLPATFKNRSPVRLFDKKVDAPLLEASLNIRKNQLEYAGCVSEPQSDMTDLSRNNLTVKQSTRGQVYVVLQQSLCIDFSKTTECEQFTINLDPLVGQAVVVELEGVNGMEKYDGRLIQVGTGLAALLEISV